MLGAKTRENIGGRDRFTSVGLVQGGIKFSIEDGALGIIKIVAAVVQDEVEDSAFWK